MTKNDDYSCVATQEEISHRIASVTSVSFNGEILPSFNFNIRIKNHYMRYAVRFTVLHSFYSKYISEETPEDSYDAH